MKCLPKGWLINQRTIICRRIAYLERLHLINHTIMPQGQFISILFFEIKSCEIIINNKLKNNIKIDLVEKIKRGCECI